MADLHQILRNFCNLEHVQGAAVFDADGLVIERHPDDENVMEPLNELVIRSLLEGNAIAEALGKAPLKQQYIEFAEKQVAAEVVHGGFVLVVLAGAGANLGRVRLEIRKNKGAVEKLLVS